MIGQTSQSKITRGLRRAKFILLVAVMVVIVILPRGVALARLPLLPMSPQVINEGHQLLDQGRHAFQGSEYVDAARFWSRAADQFKQRQDIWNQTLSLSYLSSAYQKLGNLDSAQQAIEASLSLLTALSSQDTEYYPLLAQCLNTQGNLPLAMGQPEQAYQIWQNAEQAYRQAEDEFGVIGSKINQAQALQAMGLFRQEQLLLQELASQANLLPDSALKVRGLNRLGEVLGLTGDLNLSELVLLESVALAQRLNDLEGWQAALFSLGRTQKALGRYDEAGETLSMAVDIAPTDLSRIEAQLSQLSLLLLQNERQSAGQQILHLQPQLASLQPSRASVYARVTLANHWQTLLMDSDGEIVHPADQTWGSSAAIAELLSTAVQQARAIHDQRAEAFALSQLGKLYEQTHQWAFAEDLTQQALNLSAASNAGEITYQAQWQLGRIYSKQSQQANNKRPQLTQQAIHAYQNSIQTLQTIRADLLATSSEFQFSFRERVEPIYRELVNLLITPEATEQELQVARSTIEDLQLAELQNFFRSACLDTQAKQIDGIDPQAAVIYPIILPDRIEVLVSMAGQSLSHYTTIVPSHQVEQTIDELLQALNPAFSDEIRIQLSQRVYDWLIRPVAPQLVENKIQTLAFVLDGGLKRLPMAALYDGNQYLAEKFSLALAPSLELLDPSPLNATNSKILIGALTESRQGFPALPGVALEVSEIASQLPSETFLNEAFTRDNLLTQITTLEFPILHLATHGQFSSDLNSTFLLSWDEQISINDFEALLKSRLPKVDHPIELLVLSACETAEGDELAVLGLAGLSLKSGTRSTLATLWAVNDESTALLIQQFYNNLLGSGSLSKAQALRQAQLEILKNPKFQHPYYWAPFVLVGNWL